MPERIVVTGIGAVSALGLTADETFLALRQNLCGFKPISGFNTDKYPVHFAAEVNRDSWMSQQPKLLLKRLDASAMLALMASDEALQQTGILQAGIPTQRIGIFWASGNGGIQSLDAGWQKIQESGNPLAVGPFFQANVLADQAAARIAAQFGIQGPVITTVSACASGNASILTALAYLKMNLIDVAIAGGSEAAVSPSVLAGFCAMKALSTNDNARNAVIPFGNERKGFLPGEGAACLILERENQAEARNQKPLALVSGVSLLNEAGHITNPDANANIATAAISGAIAQASLYAQDMDVIYAHGTGTIAGDLAEYTAYRNSWGDSLAHIPVVSTKHNTGHLLGASASLEAAMAVQMLQSQLVLPGHSQAGTDIHMQQPPLFIPQTSVEMNIRHVISYAAGFGGQQSALVLSAV